MTPRQEEQERAAITVGIVIFLIFLIVLFLAGREAFGKPLPDASDAPEAPYAKVIEGTRESDWNIILRAVREEMSKQGCEEAAVSITSQDNRKYEVLAVCLKWGSSGDTP